jgi:hypothetical protein
MYVWPVIYESKKKGLLVNFQLYSYIVVTMLLYINV